MVARGTGAARAVLLAHCHRDPEGWHRACLAVGLLHGAAHHYCIGGCSALFVLRGACASSGLRGGCRFSSLPPLLSLFCVPRDACGGLPHLGVPCSRLLVRHSMWSVRSGSSVRLASWFFVCALAHPRCSRFHPSPCLFACTLCKICWQNTVRALPCGLYPSAVPTQMSWSACPVFGEGGWVRLYRLPSCLASGVQPGLAAPCPWTLRLQGWGPSPTPLRPLLRCCAVWERQEGAREEGAPCPSLGCLDTGTIPLPTASPLGVQPGPAALFPGAQGCTCGGPSLTPPRRPLRAGVACSNTRLRAPRGGGARAFWRAFLVAALSFSLPRILGACSQGPLPFPLVYRKCGRGSASQTQRRTLLRAGIARYWAWSRAPIGGHLVPQQWLSGFRHFPLPDRPSFGRVPRARCLVSSGAGDVGMGTCRGPHSTRSCELLLRAVGMAAGCLDRGSVPP